MSSFNRVVASLLILLMGVSVFAQNGAATLEAFPNMVVADGRSTVTVTVRLRDQAGSLVPDGTQVVFDTSLGTLREKTATTRSGLAQVILVSGSIPGLARVSARAFRYNAVAETEVEFVTDRSLLSSAKEFIEVVGPQTLQYSVQDRILEATDEEQGAFLKYRDVEIHADDLQLMVPSYEVRARRAKIKIGDKFEQEFDELYFQLNRRTGFAIGNYEEIEPDPEGQGWPFSLPLKKRLKYGLVEVNSQGTKKPEKQFDRRLMEFRDISQALSIIEAKKAVAFPRKEVQFHSANVKLTGLSVMQVPLFKVSVNTASPLITEQFINVSNNNLAVNYPYYLTLRPGQTSALRLRYGNRYGVGTGATGGTYLDYELNWNHGDEMDGGLTVFGLARDDWGVGLRQSFSLADSTSINAQLDFPAHKSLFANASISRPFDGFSASINGSYGRSIQGDRFLTQNSGLVLELDPMRVDALPGRVYLGMSATQNRIEGEGFNNSQDSVGLQARYVSDTFRFDEKNSVNLSYKVAHRQGKNIQGGLTQLASLNWSSSTIPGLVMNVRYDFTDDPFTSQILGRHTLNFEGYFSSGPLSLNAYLSKSLDIERLTASSRLRYNLGGLWRLNYSYYYDQYGVDSFLDQSIIVSYKIGYREVGISYSHRTKRLGIEILGTSFN